MARAYFDYNATTPMRVEAKEAMISAWACAGNPSAVHAEGRAARAIVEGARQEILEALDAEGADLIFTSGASEAAALALAERDYSCGGIEHDAVRLWCHADLPTSDKGQVRVDRPAQTALQRANSETGILQDLPAGLAVSDITQAVGKIPFSFSKSDVRAVFMSAHKFGGPKGIGALVFTPGQNFGAQIKGGGQEMGRRAGTENIPAIAGFSKALKAAVADVENGVWQRVEKIKTILENSLVSIACDAICVGQTEARLPNTSTILTPGLKGETQVMQMDLAGFAVSSGSACSSGKVQKSTTLLAMGFNADIAGSAMRLSFGPDLREDAVMRFVDIWSEHYFRARGNHQ